MKFTRTAFIGIFITISIIAATTLGVMYKSATSANRLAKNNLDDVKSAQITLSKQKADLSSQLAKSVADVAAWNNKIALLQTTLGQSNDSLKQAQSQFPLTAQTIEYNETLMGLAKSSNLTMSTIVATKASNASISTSDFTFNTNIFTISVTGKVSDILGFVDKIATNAVFRTAAITPVSFSMALPLVPEPLPAPLTQAVKDQMRADIKTKMLADKDASIVGAKRVELIEKSFLELLGNDYTPISVEYMTQTIHDIIVTQFGSSTADLLSNQITQAIENNLAGSLVGTIATTYSSAVSELFIGHTSNLLPIFANSFTNKTGDEITLAIQGVPESEIPGVITKVITDKLNSMVSDKIAAMVSDSSIDAALKTAVDAAQQAAIDAVQQDNVAAAAAVPPPSAQITVAVYSFKGA